MQKITARVALEAAFVAADLDEGDAHNLSVVGRRIKDLPEANREFWQEMTILTLVNFTGQRRSKALMDLLGNLVDLLIATQDQN